MNMVLQSLYHTYQRHRTLSTDKITALPILIIMPHSACNCKCVMCDIWKDNKMVRQLSEPDITPLLSAIQQLGTKEVLMSGGEALLHPLFFRLCSLLKSAGVCISLHTTGILIKKHADSILKFVDKLIISIDGDKKTHDAVRNIPGAFERLQEGVHSLKFTRPDYRITARTVIHKLNFRSWIDVIIAAKEMGLDQISFLPADVSSSAFNRAIPWSSDRQTEIAIDKDELPELKNVIDEIIIRFKDELQEGFIAESPGKLMNIYRYYCAIHGLSEYPYKKCNAPWVSSVIEPDGLVKPCFFHPPIGNIRTHSLPEILNGEKGITFRKELDMNRNEICKRCVCYLNLPPGINPANQK